MATDVVVVGLGYIGLPTSALIARSGLNVLGVDVDPRIVATVNAGNVHIQEIDLEALVRELSIEAVFAQPPTAEPAKTFVIAVPTPLGPGNVPDTGHVMAAVATIAPVLKAGDLLILESTSPVGTTEHMRDRIGALRPDLVMPVEGAGPADIAIAYCPERVLPGRILVELIDNDRCIGGITPECARRAATFYRGFVRGACITTSARAAELVKLSENAFRDVNIAFANELSLVAHELDLDVWEVIRLANRHPRVAILSPGPGVGGHCVAVDPWFIIDSVPSQTALIRTAREVNAAKTGHVIARAAALIAAHPAARVACLGLAFKADIDDFRESPALAVAESLFGQFGPRIAIVEPHVESLPPSLSGALLIDLETALLTSDILIVLVDHSQFRAVPAAARAGKLIYDTRGMWPTEPGSGS